MPRTANRLRTALATLAAVVIAPAAIAQKAERPALKIGDRWQFVQYYTVASTEANREWVVDAITPAAIEITENGRDAVRLTSELNVLESPQVRNSNPQALKFPIEVGHRWRYESEWVFKPKNSRGGAVNDVEVVAYEKIRVPAGEFDAFRLEMKGTIRGVSGINSQIDAGVSATYWYAPAARAVVKSIARNPYLGVTNVELVKLEPQP
jgi:hypothetical protein